MDLTDRERWAVRWLLAVAYEDGEATAYLHAHVLTGQDDKKFTNARDGLAKLSRLLDELERRRKGER
jgi:hypothetical protein